MTNEEVIKEFIREFDEEAFNKLYAVSESEPCDDAVSRQVILDKIKEVCFSNEQKWVDFRVSQGSHGQRDFIINFIKSLPPVTPKQKASEWIPVKDPYTELPKKDMLWVTKDDCGCRWVDTVYYDMTEWSDSIHDVVAYALYDEPEPYTGESEIKE